MGDTPARGSHLFGAASPPGVPSGAPSPPQRSPASAAARRSLRLGDDGGGRPPPSPSSSARSSHHGSAARRGAESASAAIADLEAKLRIETADKDAALSLRTKAVRDLKATRGELRRAHDELEAIQRSLTLAKLLAHARGRIGKPAQLLRLSASLHAWRLAAAVLEGAVPSHGAGWIGAGAEDDGRLKSDP